MAMIQMKSSLISRTSSWFLPTKLSFRTRTAHHRLGNSHLLSNKIRRLCYRPRLIHLRCISEREGPSKRNNLPKNTILFSSRRNLELRIQTRELSSTRTKQNRSRINTKSSCSNSRSNCLPNWTSTQSRSMIRTWAMKWLGSHQSTTIMELLNTRYRQGQSATRTSLTWIQDNTWVKIT